MHGLAVYGTAVMGAISRYQQPRPSMTQLGANVELGVVAYRASHSIAPGQAVSGKSQPGLFQCRSIDEPTSALSHVYDNTI